MRTAFQSCNAHWVPVSGLKLPSDNCSFHLVSAKPSPGRTDPKDQTVNPMKGRFLSGSIVHAVHITLRLFY